MPGEIHHIFIADDHQLVIDGISSLITKEGDFKIIGTANDGKAAIDKVLTLRPDLLLMDMDMPVYNGMEAAKQILDQQKDQKIAILSMHSDKALVEKMAQIGIYGYIPKNADREELIGGIRTILEGKKYFHPDIVNQLLGVTTQTIKASQVSITKLGLLSAREQEILACIAEGMTSQEIGEQLHISARTVETHRKNIHNKLEIKNLAGLIRFAMEAGLVG